MRKDYKIKSYNLHTDQIKDIQDMAKIAGQSESEWVREKLEEVIKKEKKK